MSKQYKTIFLGMRCIFVDVTNEYACQDVQNKQRKIRDVVSTLLIADSNPRNIKIRFESILKNEMVSFYRTRLYIGKEIICINICSRRYRMKAVRRYRGGRLAPMATYFRRKFATTWRKGS